MDLNSNNNQKIEEITDESVQNDVLLQFLETHEDVSLQELKASFPDFTSSIIENTFNNFFKINTTNPVTKTDQQLLNGETNQLTVQHTGKRKSFENGSNDNAHHPLAQRRKIM